MNILFVVNRYYPAVGGSEIVQKRLAEGLVKIGHEVTVYTTDFLNSDGNKRVEIRGELINGVKVVRFNGLRFVKDPFTLSFKMFRSVRKNQKDFDAIYAFSYGYATTWFPTLLRGLGMLNTPIIIQPHYAPNNNFSGFLTKLYDLSFGRISLSNADYVIDLTRAYEDFFYKNGVKEENLKIILPIIPPTKIVKEEDIKLVKEKLSIPEADSYILCLSRITKYKGMQFVVDGFAEYIKKNSIEQNKTYLIIAGNGDYKSSLIDQVKKLGIDEYVTFSKDRVDDDQRDVLYNLCDIYAMLSYSGESFGVVFVEAMSVGASILASNYGAIPFVVKNGVHGEVVDPRDKESVAESIKSLIDNKGSYSKSNIEYSKQFSEEDVISQIDELFSKVLEEYR